MSRETLLEELHRLLDAGEPLLDVFPKKHSDGWSLRLPDNISEDMGWYADEMAFRAWNRNQHQDDRLPYTTTYLTQLIETSKAGLLGWCAIGALR